MLEYYGKRKRWIKWLVFPLLMVFAILNSGNINAESPTSQFSKISDPSESSGLYHLCPADESIAPEVILIPKARSWLISLLLPYLRCNQTSSLPVLLVFPDQYAANFDRFLTGIKNRNILSFLNPEILNRDYLVNLPRLNTLSIKDDPFEASLQLAKYFPHQSSEIVLTVVNNPVHFIQASLFAAHFSIPLVAFQSKIDTHALETWVAEKNIQKIYLIAKDNPGISISSLIPVTRLSLTEVDRRVVRRLGADRIRNLIITNPFFKDPKHIGVDPDLVHYAPYISLLRQSPLILSLSNKGSDAEKVFRSFTQKYGINPTTITLVGNYSMISTVKVDDKLRDQIFQKKEMRLEPLSSPIDGHALPFGIGRLPFSKIDCLSMYYARLKELERTLVDRFPRFTMIANLESDKRKKLMLAESISRLTVKELKNFSFEGDEFYGKSPDDPDIWETALKSDLIIYEGHIEQFALIKEKQDSTNDTLKHYEAPYFNHFPFMILQSCDSLKNHEVLLDRGISGMIGSCSKVHSASGSATIKTLLDSMLYDGTNYGEALRDAKNYSLSIVELKKRRGHTQQDKTLRSALTFRLMGDPQARLFFKKLPSPVRKPLKAEFVDDQTIQITTPHRHYPEVKNKCYKLRLFPKAEAAGIVSRSVDPTITMRCINPLYFFKLPLNQRQKNIGKFEFKEDHSLSPRSVNLIDPLGRWIYLLHYPKKELKNQRIILRSK